MWGLLDLTDWHWPVRQHAISSIHLVTSCLRAVDGMGFHSNGLITLRGNQHHRSVYLVLFGAGRRGF